MQLDWANEAGQVTVTPHDKSRFIIKVRQAVEACRAAQRADDFAAQLNLLLGQLATWLQDKTGIESAYLTLRDGDFLFLVVRSECSYDRDFEDSLSDLDLQIAQDADLDLIKVDTMALPRVSDEALRSFLDPHFVLEYPHGPRA